MTIFLSLIPASWLGWTSDLAALVRIPVTPISHIGIMFTSWVRPSLEPSDLPSDEKERNELAIAERDHYRQMYHAQMLRATELADQLRELQSLPETALRNPQPPIIIQVDVTGNRPSDVSGTIELKLIREASSRIRVGDIAIVGRDIVGRISSVGMTRIGLMPTTNKEMGLTRAAIVPAHPSNTRSPLLAEVILQSNGEAQMFAEVVATSGVKKGDLVQLDDSSWPEIGAGLTLGVVEDVMPLDEAPLRQRVIIAPRRIARNVSRVVVLGTGEDKTE
ncbi:MAG: hypothetical protein ISR75_03605 [Phycisphaerales bacterium]|nr:hypothetical protein [Planctomycetota bacterium]MBL6997504.1 hypothetical protein [Phycisphaerales bacterium]